MKIIFVNGSPKTGKNNSQYFIGEIERMIQESKDVSALEMIEVRVNRPQIDAADKEIIAASDILVLCFPLYVDAIPSQLLQVLVELESSFQNRSKRPIVYAVVNCGFFDAIQNHLVFEVIRNWCRRSGLEWGQGAGIGAGEMQGGLESIPCGKGPKTSLGKMLMTLVGNMLHKSAGQDLFANPNFPRFGFIWMGHLSWCQMAKQNGIKRKDIFFQP